LHEKTLEAFYLWLCENQDRLDQESYVYSIVQQWTTVILNELRYRKAVPAYETLKRLLTIYPDNPEIKHYWDWCETDYLRAIWEPKPI
jgi:hypothetical protein